MKTLVVRGMIDAVDDNYFFYSSLGPVYIISSSPAVAKYLPDYNQLHVQIRADINRSKLNILSIKALAFDENLGAHS